MKKIKKTITFLLFIIVMTACTQISEEEILSSNKVTDEIEVEYYNNPTFVRNIFDPKNPPNTLTLKDVFISAEDEENILVKTGNKEIRIKKPENYTHISQGEVSYDGNYVAFQIGQHEGEKTIVVDDKNEKILLISDQETVLLPRWSPHKNVLAISVGSIAHQKLALYDPKTGKIQILTTDYISIMAIKWDKNGEFIDFVAEEPSDNFVLYHYQLSNKITEKIKEMTREEKLEFYGTLEYK